MSRFGYMSPFNVFSGFSGFRIIEDPNCLAATSERTFPESRHRSKRIHKKLVKRYGGEFRMEPAMFKIGDHTIVCHPARYAELKAAMERTR